MDDRTEEAAPAVALGDDIIQELQQAVEALRTRERSAGASDASFVLLEDQKVKARTGMHDMNDVLEQHRADVAAMLGQRENDRKNAVDERIAAIKAQLERQP